MPYRSLTLQRNALMWGNATSGNALAKAPGALLQGPRRTKSTDLSGCEMNEQLLDYSLAKVAKWRRIVPAKASTPILQSASPIFTWRWPPPKILLSLCLG